MPRKKARSGLGSCQEVFRAPEEVVPAVHRLLHPPLGVQRHCVRRRPYSRYLVAFGLSRRRAWVVGQRLHVCWLGSRGWPLGGLWEAGVRPLGGRFGASWGLFGAFWGSLLGVFGAAWVFLGASWGVLGAS